MAERQLVRMVGPRRGRRDVERADLGESLTEDPTQRVPVDSVILGNEEYLTKSMSNKEVLQQHEEAQLLAISAATRGDNPNMVSAYERMRRLEELNSHLFNTMDAAALRQETADLATPHTRSRFAKQMQEAGLVAQYQALVQDMNPGFWVARGYNPRASALEAKKRQGLTLTGDEELEHFLEFVPDRATASMRRTAVDLVSGGAPMDARQRLTAAQDAVWKVAEYQEKNQLGLVHRAIPFAQKAGYDTQRFVDSAVLMEPEVLAAMGVTARLREKYGSRIQRDTVQRNLNAADKAIADGRSAGTPEAGQMKVNLAGQAAAHRLFKTSDEKGFEAVAGAQDTMDVDIQLAETLSSWKKWAKTGMDVESAVDLRFQEMKRGTPSLMYEDMVQRILDPDDGPELQSIILQDIVSRSIRPPAAASATPKSAQSKTMQTQAARNAADTAKKATQ